VKILVTGGAGFIGSHLIERLLNRGEKVICVDNMSLGKKQFLFDAVKNSNFELYEFDLTDIDKLDNLFVNEDIETIYHLAANSDIQLGYHNLKTDYLNTFLTTYNVLTCMKMHGSKNIVFASSSAIYGEHAESIREDTGPLIPVSNYGAAKLSSEAFISSYCYNYGLNAWIVRFPNVIGWRLTHGVIFDFLNKLERDPSQLLILGNGKQKKPYLYVMDLLDAIELIFQKTNDRINVFNVAPNTGTTVDFIARMVAKGLGLEKVKYKYTGGDRGWIGDVPKFHYETDKIKSLEWTPKYTSDEAVVHSIEREISFRKNGSS